MTFPALAAVCVGLTAGGPPIAASKASSAGVGNWWLWRDSNPHCTASKAADSYRWSTQPNFI